MVADLVAMRHEYTGKLLKQQGHCRPGVREVRVRDQALLTASSRSARVRENVVRRMRAFGLRFANSAARCNATTVLVSGRSGIFGQEQLVSLMERIV